MSEESEIIHRIYDSLSEHEESVRRNLYSAHTVGAEYKLLLEQELDGIAETRKFLFLYEQTEDYDYLEAVSKNQADRAILQARTRKILEDAAKK